MPYKIEKQGNEYCLVRADGTTKQCHKSRRKAVRARRAIMMYEAMSRDKTASEKVRGDSASTIHSIKELGKKK